MITNKIKALFQFIEFLHSNIDNFKQHDKLINELDLLVDKRNELKPNNSFKDKISYDEIQTIIESKFKVIQDSIISPIKAKARELHICNIKDITATIYNWNIDDICNLKRDWKQDDLSEILSHKKKYLEYLEKTENEEFFMGELLGGLKEILTLLFDYFNESDQSEFEKFRTESIKVDNLIDGLKLMFGKENHFISTMKFWDNMSPTNKLTYEKYKQHFIDNSAYEFDNGYKIYNSETTILLIPCEPFKGMDLDDNKKMVLVDSESFLSSYKQGFDEAVKWFKDTYRDPKNEIDEILQFIKNKKNIVKDAVSANLATLNLKDIKNRGYSAGFCSQIEYLEEVYPIIFTKKMDEAFTPQPNEKPKPAGKPKAETKTAIECITLKIADQKEEFLTALKKEYKESKPRDFALLLFVLRDMEIIDKLIKNKTIKDAFENCFEKEYGTQTNFNKHFINFKEWNKPKNSLFKEIEAIKTKINQLKTDNLVV